MSKINDWKQITTVQHKQQTKFIVYQLCQRSMIESKSQRFRSCSFRGKKCISYVKDQWLKANHNSRKGYQKSTWSVSVMSKINDWKQITTPEHFIKAVERVYQLCQRSMIESKSQLEHISSIGTPECISYVKDQWLKANHNRNWWQSLKLIVYQLCQRSMIESKSQRIVN